MINHRCVSNTVSSVQFRSVIQSCPTLCHPMDCSTPDFPVHHQLLNLGQTHGHQVGDAIQPSILSSVIASSCCLQSFPASRSFPMSQFFTSGGQNIGASASASVLPMNTQDWIPLGWSGWISLQFQRLLRVFSNTIIQKHHFCAQPCLSPIKLWSFLLYDSYYRCFKISFLLLSTSKLW